ncbi:MAG: ABC transporter ATP-binding protein [Planctomycetota bacterium]|jgi:subfamily B ATP-binding cassette protein MsbA|nr:ABC transporter ATP-binding protein [Planctomycetota bacterium]MDP7129517.1 ABC transporter ATP-binding protein [Planctomycetota bacterium]
MDSSKPKYQYIVRLLRYALAYRVHLVLAIAASMLYGIGKAFIPALVKVVFDSGLLPGFDKESTTVVGRLVQGFGWDTTGVLYAVTGLIFAVAAFLFIAELASGYYSGFLINRIMLDVRCDLCQKLLGMSLSFYNDRKNGDLISRLTNDILVTSQATSLLFNNLIKQTWLLIACLIGMLILNWKLTILVMIFAPILALFMRKLGKKVLRASTRSLEDYSELTDEMSQIFSGVRIVKVFHMEEKEMNEFRSISERLFSSQMRVVVARSLSRAMTTGSSHAALGIAACCGIMLLQRNFISPADLFAFLGLVASLYRPLKTLGTAYNNVNEALAATGRIFELVDTQPEVQDRPDAVPLPDDHSGVRFEKVSFAYNGEYVLEGVDLEVQPGELVAFVGSSGSGKSTLLDLIPRFYDPQEGHVEVDGIDLRKIQRSTLLEKIAVVTQQSFLFNTTIGENIRYARPDASNDEVKEASRLAQIHDFIEGLSDGYDTAVGEQGVKLSGGQRQRISLARAFLKGAPILILDEATSELDTETERQIQQSLKVVSRGCTTLVVAHRLSTIVDADRIVVMSEGRIVEVGTHEDLLERRGDYHRLYNLQFGSEAGTAGNGPQKDRNTDTSGN